VGEKYRFWLRNILNLIFFFFFFFFFSVVHFYFFGKFWFIFQHIWIIKISSTWCCNDTIFSFYALIWGYNLFASNHVPSSRCDPFSSILQHFSFFSPSIPLYDQRQWPHNLTCHHNTISFNFKPG